MEKALSTGDDSDNTLAASMELDSSSDELEVECDDVEGGDELQAGAPSL